MRDAIKTLQLVYIEPKWQEYIHIKGIEAKLPSNIKEGIMTLHNMS